MLRKSLKLLCLASLLVASRASAITYGEPDGGDHPNVGAILIEDETGQKIVECSGTLISPTVFLTAAHCVDDSTVPFWITFDSTITANSRLYTGTVHLNPAYNQTGSDPGDLAVIVFARPIRGIPPAALPPAGMLDRMSADGTLRNQTFTAVGYGLQEVILGEGPPDFAPNYERRRAVSSFSALNDAWLRLSQTQATDDGGTCYGDSGGPIFLGSGDAETSVVAAIAVAGDELCMATNVTYRLDTAAARAFLGQFVILP